MDTFMLIVGVFLDVVVEGVGVLLATFALATFAAWTVWGCTRDRVLRTIDQSDGERLHGVPSRIEVLHVGG